MIIEKFVAQKVHGYMDFEIKFDERLNFLVGLNGSGKTTVLKIINYIFDLDFHRISKINFDLIFISFKCPKSKKRIHFFLFNIVDKVGFLIFETGDPKIYPDNGFSEKINNFINFTSLDDVTPVLKGLADAEDMNFSFVEHIEHQKRHDNNKFLDFKKTLSLFDDFENEFKKVKRKLDEIGRPVFLGLDRSHAIDKDDEESGLHQSRDLISSFYEKFKKEESKLSKNLITEILNSLFQPLKGKDIYNIGSYNSVLSRKNDLEDMLNKISNNNDELMSALKSLFDHAERLNKALSMDKNKNREIEIAINLSQIKRLSDVISVFDENKKHLDLISEPKDNFLETVNQFFSFSGKSIDINNLGVILAKSPSGDEFDISLLSSGEKQLIIILAHFFMDKSSDENYIFIIDEPEISLHIKWQEMLADILVEKKSTCQFIFATHSPEIIAGNEDKAISLTTSLGENVDSKEK